MLKLFKKNGGKDDGNTKHIEQQMKAAHLNEKRTQRILFLGPGNSGKTTIIKQMRKIHNTLSDSDIELMKPYIQDSIVAYMKVLCRQAKEIAEKDDEKATQVEKKNEALIEELFKLTDPYTFDDKLSQLISTLWDDSAIKATLKFRSQFQIHDNVEYFLDRVSDICDEKYQPSFDDYLRIRTRTTGSTIERIRATIEGFGECTFEFTDVGGQRCERKKWMRMVKDEIQAVLYVVALSEYDLALFEDNKTNCLVEALNLFKEVINNRFFHKKTVLVFFNKYDLFKEKIKKVPITVAFPDFPVDTADPHDEEEVVKFVASKFLSSFDGQDYQLATPLHIHRTTALDTTHIQKLFTDISVDLVKGNLASIGVF